MLTPESPYYSPDDLPGLIAMLRKIGFIDGPLDDSDRRYLLGEHFMQWVTFMGCSPYIELEPGEPGQPFSHLVIEGPSTYPRLLQGRNTTPPRCAACRKRLGGWQATFETWRREQPGWLATCPHCGHTQDPASYDFRRSAGCGRLFLCVEHIFPQEAIPSPSLLNHLRDIAEDQAWRYFYQQKG